MSVDLDTLYELMSAYADRPMIKRIEVGAGVWQGLLLQRSTRIKIAFTPDARAPGSLLDIPIMERDDLAPWQWRIVMNDDTVTVYSATDRDPRDPPQLDLKRGQGERS